MIQRLHIKDFAIIDEIDINFNTGLTVITGETGSGKSVILEALGVALGAKADKLMVRSDTRRAIIQAVFLDSDIRRLISSKGRTKSYIDDIPVSITNLKKRNEGLVDFHGQHDQQLILDRTSQLDYLDQFCGHMNEVSFLKQTYFELTELKIKLEQVQRSTQERKDRLDLLKFQLNDINNVNPSIDEDVQLNDSYKRLSNIEQIIKILQSVKSHLSDNDLSLIDQIVTLQNELNVIEKYDSNFKHITSLINESIIHLQEAGSEISSELLGLEYDPEELNALEERLNAIESLKRKYGGSLESVLEKKSHIISEISSIENPKNSEKEIIKTIKNKEIEFSKTAILVHRARKLQSKELSEKIEKAMSELNMPSAQFEIIFEQEESKDGFVDYNRKLLNANPQGIDKVEFYLSANKGQPPKPLASIASGGEISRIMLAIKTVFQNKDPVKTLVFDEIDSGISGHAAEKVAKHLSKLSKSKQIICITHLSQIAIKADNHIHIVKYVKDSDTHVEVKYLNKVESSKVIQDLFVGVDLVNA